MEKFLVKKRIVKSIFKAKLLLLLFSVTCLTMSVVIFNNTIEQNPELVNGTYLTDNFNYEQ